MTQKTIAHYLSDLRLDLKDSGSLWSDAELTRCVERAVGDLSRFLPDERSLEITVDAEVDDESFTTPAATDTDYFVTSWDISAVSDGAAATLAARRPDVPRPVKITVTDANTSITQLVVIVKGQDVDNKYMEEFFYLEGGLVQTGKQYFALVTGVEIDEIAGGGAADTMIVGTGSHLGVYVQLANKPIKSASDSISSQTRDEDYEMDYASGRIAMKSGGGMAASTAYTIDYTRSRLEIDLSTYIDDLIRVDKVEYPVGNVPQQFSKLEVWGKTMVLTGGMDSQAEVTDEEHFVIRYLTSHSAPNAQSPGSYPGFLDFTVQLAASAYALFIYALKQEHQVATDLASARTSLGNLTAIHTQIESALDKVTTYVTDMDTALDAAIVQFAAAATALGKINSDGTRTYLTDADAALDNAVTALAKVPTYLENNTNEDAKYWLTKITTDIANLRTSIETAVDAVATNLGLVFTSSIDKATTGAEALLDSGDNFIDALNDGARVPENYREYAQARSEIANARLTAAGIYIQEAVARLSNLQSYISQAIDGWAKIADGFVAEAAQRINEAAARVAIADRYLVEAQQRVAAGQGYVTEADGRYRMCRAFIEEAEQRINEINSYIADAARYNETASNELLLADRFRAEAIERRNEAWAIWASPNQIAPNYALGQRAQPT